MSGSDWRRNITFEFLISVTVAITFIFFVNGVYYHHTQARQRDEAAKSYANKAADEIYSDCIASDGEPSVCFEKTLSAQINDYYTHYDLQAQQDMAIWGYGMFIAAFATALVTLAGVVYVARTLVETKRAADATWKYGELQTAPEVVIQNKIIAVRGSKNRNWLKFYVRNFGQSTAYRFNPSAVVEVFRGDEIVETLRYKKNLTWGQIVPAAIAPRSDNPESSMLVFDGKYVASDEDRIAFKNGALHVRGVISLRYWSLSRGDCSFDWRFETKMWLDDVNESKFGFSAVDAQPVD